MKLAFCRRPPQPPVPQASGTEIAVLEYDLYGIEPAPGTLAAAMINLRALSPNYRPGPLDLDQQARNHASRPPQPGGDQP